MRHILFSILAIIVLTNCEKDPTANPEPPLPPAKVDTTLVAHFTFNGDAKDQTQYKNNTIVYGAKLAKDSLGMSNSAYMFDGTSFIEIFDSDKLDFVNNQVSLMAWIKPAETSLSYVIQKETFLYEGQLTGGGGPFSLDIFPGQTRSLIYGNSNKDFVELVGTTPIKKDTWQHIALTWDGEKAYLYYNGRLEASGDFKDSILSTNGSINIGAYKWAYPQAGFKGAIDNVRIYNRCVKKEEIEEFFKKYK